MWVLCQSALALLVLGVLADHHDLAVTLDDLALFAHLLHRRSDFHTNAFLSLRGPGIRDPVLEKVILS